MPSNRAGTYRRQPTGYRAFHPRPLPPEPLLDLTGELQVRLSEADRALGRLDAAADLLPDPDLFVAMYVRKEAVFSSQIEGTQASLEDVLEYQADRIRAGRLPDIQEVVNYVAAMNYGIDRLGELPLSLRLIREIHAKLLEGVRGQDKQPGEFRRSQNWIGPPGVGLADATYVPPPPHEVRQAMGALEGFWHDESPIPILIRCGLAHAQFEAIHPFLDGNGRIGRLLITFMLCWRGVLQRPLLYLSAYFKQNRGTYYQRLQSVRDDGAWEEWMLFFLTGVRDVARQAAQTARAIQHLREEHRARIARELPGTPNGQRLLDALFDQPFMNVNQIGERIERSYPVANELATRFERIGLLVETTGQKRNRVYAYQPYLELVVDGPD